MNVAFWADPFRAIEQMREAAKEGAVNNSEEVKQIGGERTRRERSEGKTKVRKSERRTKAAINKKRKPRGSCTKEPASEDE